MTTSADKFPYQAAATEDATDRDPMRAETSDRAPQRAAALGRTALAHLISSIPLKLRELIDLECYARRMA